MIKVKRRPGRRSLSRRHKLRRVPRQVYECGSCHACCIHMPVEELGKAAGSECQHLCQGEGCVIYKRRPGVCLDFVCNWVMGDPMMSLGDDGGSIDMPSVSEWRPDRSNVLVWLGQSSPPVEFGGTGRPEMTVYMQELSEGVLESRAVDALAMMYQLSWPLVRICADGTRRYNAPMGA